MKCIARKAKDEYRERKLARKFVHGYNYREFRNIGNLHLVWQYD